MSIDPIIPLSISIAEGTKAYAVFLGSGVSTEAGILTGGQLFTNTIELLYKMENHVDEIEDKNILNEWFEGSDYKDWNYSDILENTCPSREDRKNFLEEFFEGKEPTKAHEIIADMVDNGLIKVIITTNFDRLMEKALNAKGITPDIISEEKDLKTKPPRELSKHCWILKLHGDYKQCNIRNTKKELAKLDEKIDEQFQEVLNTYGILSVGYSGSDVGVMDCFENRINPRYTLYWSTREKCSDNIEKLLEQQNGRTIKRNSADNLLIELSRKIDIFLTHKTGETPEFLIQEVKDFIKNEDFISLNETIKNQMKIIQNKFYEISKNAYDEQQELTDEDKEIDVIKYFEEFEKYSDTLTAIGLILIEYHEFIEKSKTDYFSVLLKLLNELYELTEIIIKLHESNKEIYDPKIVYIPRSAINNIYYCLGAYAVKKEFSGILHQILHAGIHLERFKWKKIPIWSLLNGEPLITFDKKPAKILKFLETSYDNKDFLNEFFSSKQEFIMSLCQFNYIILLYSIKTEEDSDLILTYVYPYFVKYLMKGYIRRLIIRIKMNFGFFYGLAGAFGVNNAQFKELLPILCEKIKEKLGISLTGYTGTIPEYNDEVNNCKLFDD